MYAREDTSNSSKIHRQIPGKSRLAHVSTVITLEVAGGITGTRPPFGYPRKFTAHILYMAQVHRKGSKGHQSTQRAAGLELARISATATSRKSTSDGHRTQPEGEGRSVNINSLYLCFDHDASPL